MKRFLILFTMVFAVAGMSVAASSKDAVVADLNMYNNEINPKIIGSLAKIEQEMAEIDKIIEGNSTKDIKTSIKIVENQVQQIEKHMKAQTSKIKTEEVKKYHEVTLEYIKLRYNFLKDVADVFIKKGKLDDKDKEALSNKYAPEFDKLNQANTAALQVLMQAMHPDIAPADNKTK